MRDFRNLVREAHRRGLRIITELVINHTSDQHRWFQRARHARPGSPWRDYYVWSDSDQKYGGTRIIFTDTEKSNWAWDPVAQAYYCTAFSRTSRHSTSTTRGGCAPPSGRCGSRWTWASTGCGATTDKTWGGETGWKD